jgi:hypothetical protein
MSVKKHIPSIPVPDFEKRLVDSDEIKALKSRTLEADPFTGMSTRPVKMTYSDIVKGFGITEPSEVYTPTAEDIARFKKINPAVSFINNVIVEENPDEKEFDLLPHPCTLFHN